MTYEQFYAEYEIQRKRQHSLMLGCVIIMFVVLNLELLVAFNHGSDTYTMILMFVAIFITIVDILLSRHVYLKWWIKKHTTPEITKLLQARVNQLYEDFSNTFYDNKDNPNTPELEAQRDNLEQQRKQLEYILQHTK